MELENLKAQKNNDYKLHYLSSTKECDADLGTVEKDSCGMFGKFEKEDFRGSKIFDLFIKKDFKSILDVGAGKLEATEKFIQNEKEVYICDFDDGLYYKNTTCDKEKIKKLYLGDFLTITFHETYDAVWCAHVLEHQLNPNIFLKKVHSIIKEDGYLCIIVPPRKPIIVGGHVSIWNAGLLMYHLIHAGFDCSNASIFQYDYNIGIIIKKKSIDLPKLHYDIGDIKKLKAYFPKELSTETDSFNGDILRLNI